MCGMDHNDGRVILSFTMDHYTTCGMGCVLLPVIWVIKCCFISIYLFFLTVYNKICQNLNKLHLQIFGCGSFLFPILQHFKPTVHPQAPDLYSLIHLVKGHEKKSWCKKQQQHKDKWTHFSIFLHHPSIGGKLCGGYYPSSHVGNVNTVCLCGIGDRFCDGQKIQGH